MKRGIMLIIILYMIFCIPVNAKENKLYLKESDNKIYYDSSSIDKGLFMNHQNMVPGNSYIDELIIENGTKKQYTLFFKMKARQNSEVTNQLLENINMKIYLDDELIYNGTAKGTNDDENTKLQNAIRLKEFKAKEKAMMRVETALDEDYSNGSDKEPAYVDWTFYAQLDDQKVDGNIEEIIESPETYDNGYKLMVLLTISIIGLIIAICFKKGITNKEVINN